LNKLAAILTEVRRLPGLRFYTLALVAVVAIAYKLVEAMAMLITVLQ
jgi:hypothetical protein